MAFLTSGSCPGTYVRIWTAFDDCGNQAESAIQYVATVDTLAPEFDFCPEDITVYLDENCSTDVSTDVTGMATVTDNCDGDVTISIYHSDSAPLYTCDGSDGTAEGSYTFTRTWTAIACDDSGNETTQTHDQQFTVNDEIDPMVTIAGPADYAADLAADCTVDTAPGSAGEATASAAYNCDSDDVIDITYEDSALEYTCDDSDGNAEGS